MFKRAVTTQKTAVNDDGIKGKKSNSDQRDVSTLNMQQEEKSLLTAAQRSCLSVDEFMWGCLKDFPLLWTAPHLLSFLQNFLLTLDRFWELHLFDNKLAIWIFWSCLNIRKRFIVSRLCFFFPVPCLYSPWMMLKLLVWWEQRELRAERHHCGRRRTRSGSARRSASLVWSVGPGSGT